MAACSTVAAAPYQPITVQLSVGISSWLVNSSKAHQLLLQMPISFSSLICISSVNVLPLLRSHISSLLKVPSEKLELKLHNWNDTLYITGRHFYPMSPNEPRQATPLLSRANFSAPFSHSTNAYGDLWLEEATHQLPSKTGLALAESQGGHGVTTKPFSYCSVLLSVLIILDIYPWLPRLWCCDVTHCGYHFIGMHHTQKDCSVRTSPICWYPSFLLCNE